MIGDRPAGMMTFETRPCHWIAWPPAAAIVAPTTPPMSACDELDGMPRSQVSKFQMIPPARPAATTCSVTRFVSTRPLAIVAATASERNAPTRFSTPDRATATRGLSALVAIDVAIALPVSWNPLVKSKERATTTTRTSTTSFLTRKASLADMSGVERRSELLRDSHLAGKVLFTYLLLKRSAMGTSRAPFVSFNHIKVPTEAVKPDI